jgi:hypothetical protein
MIIVNLKGGVGNQMFQYAVGKTIALKNSVELKIDLTFLQNQPSNKDHTFREYDLNIFNIDEKFLTEEDSKSYKINPFYEKVASKLIAKGVIRERHFHFCPEISFITTLPRSVTVIREKQFHFDPEILKLGANVYLDGFWQSYKYFEAFESEIRKEFSFRNKFDDINEQLSIEIQSTNSVCLNVRRLDFVSSHKTNKFHGVCDMDYFNRAIAIIASRITDFKIFVFSDDIPWCQENMKTNYPMQIVGPEYAGEKYQYKFRHMSLCKHFIIPNSTFGWWAAWLNNDPDKIVIAPKKWFNDPTIDTRDLIPEGWIRI